MQLKMNKIKRSKSFKPNPPDSPEKKDAVVLTSIVQKADLVADLRNNEQFKRQGLKIDQWEYRKSLSLEDLRSDFKNLDQFREKSNSDADIRTRTKVSLLSFFTKRNPSACRRPPEVREKTAELETELTQFCKMCNPSVLYWLGEIRYLTESYDQIARESAVKIRDSVVYAVEANEEMRSPYENVRLKLKHADICRVSVIFDEDVADLELPVVVVPEAVPEDVRLWRNELRFDYSSEEEYEDFEQQDVLKSLEGIPEDSSQLQKTSPFPVTEDVPELRRKSEKFTRQTATIHWVPSSKTQIVTKSVDVNLNYERVQKISVDGVTKKIAKGQTVRLDHGRIFLVDEKGNILETLKDNVRIIDKKVNKKEVELTGNDNKTYHLYFENTKDAKQNAELGLVRSSSFSEKTTIKNRLLRLLGKRSSRDLLEKKGIIKPEPIFGNTIKSLKEKFQASVPEFVTKTIELIELPKNITSQGIYRASGNLATIQKVRFEIDRGNLKILEEYQDDVDVLTGALKLFFRELTEPLISKEVYEELVVLLGIEDEKLSSEKVIQQVNKLPKSHKDSFQTIVFHLLRVEEFRNENRMDMHNLSVVWGPSLLWFPDSFHGENLLKNSANAVRVMEMVLNAYKVRKAPVVVVPTRSVIAPERPTTLNLSSKSSFNNKNDNNLSPSPVDYCLKSPMKGGIFGGSLQNLSDISKQNIPEFVQRAVLLIERNIGCVGVYRQSGDKLKIDRIKKKLAKNRLGSLEKFKGDTYELACVLKQFFKELRVPLVPQQIADVYTLMHDRIDSTTLASTIQLEIDKLHASHRETLNFLLDHLWRVIDNDVNRMTKEAVAIVWAPTLFQITTNQKEEVEICAKFVQLLLDMRAPKSIKNRGKSVYDNVRGEASILEGDRLTKL